MDQLRSERVEYENRLTVATKAIEHLEQAQREIESPTVDKALQALLDQWEDQRDGAESRLQRITAQLERLDAPAEDPGKGLTVTLEEFARGRGLNLALALGGFIFTWLTLTTRSRLLGRLDRGRRTTASHLTRAAALVFRILTLVLGLFAAAAILYTRGDWLLLTLLILLVLSLPLGLRQSLPRHVKDIRLLLNLGGVREGERLIYAGIPWEIATLNYFTTLRNPWLSGGELRLPLDRLIERQSRPYAPPATLVSQPRG